MVSRSAAVVALEAGHVVRDDGHDPGREARVRGAVKEHHALVYRLLRRMGVPERDVEDAQQQVFWVYARQLDRVEAGRDRAFLFGVAVRVAHATRRRLDREEPVDDDALATVAAPARGVEEQLEERRARALLDSLLEAMPFELRAVLVLHDLEEWTMRDIASALAVPAGTVASRLRRAREMLVRAAKAEQPPPGNEARVLAALGLGPAGAASGAQRRVMTRTGLGAWARWFGLGLLATSALAASAGAARARRSPPAADPPCVAAIDRGNLLVIAPVTLEGRSRAERAPVHFGLARASARSDAPGHRAPACVSSTVPHAAAPVAPDDELARIRDARRALVRHDDAAALTALDDYARRFPRGALAEEAAALRVQALFAAGRPRDARRAANAFDAAYPHSPYGPRVDALCAEGDRR